MSLRDAARWIAGLGFALAACAGQGVPSRRPGAAPPVAGPAASAASIAVARSTPGAPRTAPHGGSIVLVALTDRGDAALTADSVLELRLWLALDGSREPIVVHGPPAVQLALGSDRDGLYAAILDPAGGVTLVRFDAGGGELGRTQLAAPAVPAAAPATQAATQAAAQAAAQAATQAAIEQVVAIPGGVLVRRADHTIERFDPRGVRTGRLVPAAGQRVVALAVRRDRAIAGLATGTDRATVARWIALDGGLGWGEALALPEPLAALAVAPDGRRLAGLARNAQLGAEVGEVVELAPEPAVVAIVGLARSHGTLAGGAPEGIGFVDDQTLVLDGPHQRVWIAAGPDRQWSTVRQATSAGEPAVTDRVVAAHGGGLELAARDDVHFLGYHWLGASHPTIPGQFVDGHGVLLQVQGGTLWLDPRLNAHPVPIDPERDELLAVLDDRHVLFAPHREDPMRAVVLLVRDVVTRSDTEIAVLPDLAGVRYDAATRVLSIARSDHVERYQIALAPVSATPLDVQPFPRAVPGASVWRDLERSALGHGGPAAPRAESGHNQVTVFDAHGNVRWRRSVFGAGPVQWSRDDRTLFLAAEGGLAMTFDAATGAVLAERCGWGFGLYDHEIVQTAEPPAPSACAATDPW